MLLSSGASWTLLSLPTISIPSYLQPRLTAAVAGAGWAVNLVSHHVGSPRGPWHPSQHFIFQTIPLAFSPPPLALVQHLCSLGDLVQKEVISAIPTALLCSHLCHGILACLWPEGAMLLFQSLPSTTEKGSLDCLLGSGGKDEQQCLIAWGTGRGGGHRAVCIAREWARGTRSH